MTAGISSSGREELAAVSARGERLLTVERTAAKLGVDRVEASKKLSRWTEQGWLRRVRRGLYIPVPVDVEYPELWSEDPLVLADAVWSPCLFTGWTAASQWGLTDQIFRTIVVRTTGRVRASRQQLLEHDYLVGNIGKLAMTWSLRAVWQRERRLFFADEARTVIDVLDDPAIGGGIRHVAEILDAYLADFDWLRLVDYGDLIGNGTVFKRLGFLADSLQLGNRELLDACSKRLSGGVSLLDPGSDDVGPRSARWGLRVNVRTQRSDPA